MIDAGVDPRLRDGYFEGRPAKVQASAAAEFFAKITANATVVTDARWVYTADEVDPTGAALPGGREGIALINTVELGHSAEPGPGTPWIVFGVDVHGPDYPAGFRPRPIGGGGQDSTHKVDVVVMVREIIHDAETLYRFDLQGSHDGICTP